MFKNELELVPNKPGSYQMYNLDNQIIYIGKAKDLKKRLNSYFNRQVKDKTLLLVNEVNHFEYIITNTEIEAFILELNLIKKYDPKYNVLLTDDKSYPYIEYIKHPFPTLKIVRYLKIKKNKNNKLFGPFPNAFAAKKIVNLINRLYPLKKCEGMPKQVCLYYHIDECLGYCVHKISDEILMKMENEIIEFLNGNARIIKDKIMERLNFHSTNMNYEIAASLREELNYMSIILDKQKVELSDLVNRDVINYYSDNNYCCIIIFFIRHGKLLEVFRDVFPVINSLQENIEQYIVQYYEKHEIPSEILVCDDLNIELLNDLINTSIKVPNKGEKKKIIDLVKENAKTHLENTEKLIINSEKRTINANDELRKLLNLRTLNTIESFDNSNLFGNYSVSGMVVFKNGLPSKNDYRKYKISIEKNDDYHMMKEVIYRRYYRQLMEKNFLPDLILVDGGINQINATKSVLNDLNINIKICGLKKDESHTTNMLIDGDSLEEYSLEKQSDLFHYLIRIQDETHRYTINYHKTIRSKGSLSSVLDDVPGIGEKRKKELLKKYKGLKNILKANKNELNKILTESVATKLIDVLQKKNL